MHQIHSKFSFLLAFFCLFFLSCEAKKDSALATTPAPAQAPQPQSFQASIEKLYVMATFFSEAMTAQSKDPNSLKTKFCGIEPEQITFYSMAVKSRIDEWVQDRTYNNYPDVEKCSDSCMCSLYIGLDESLVPDDKKRDALTKTAQANAKKENAEKCLASLPNFCESTEFKQLKTEVTTN